MFNDLFESSSSCNNLYLKIFRDYGILSKKRQGQYSLFDVLQEVFTNKKLNQDPDKPTVLLKLFDLQISFK
jgi:hypothetical protein